MNPSSWLLQVSEPRTSPCWLMSRGGLTIWKNSGTARGPGMPLVTFS
ncbi:unnamed protein product [Staurois parvus]|uniref:Uncharacterized protein n=1 Tax=Staurois parvus TaxID=386267 RepID=A0ABN9F716_9NEOB|nr:unnamed protein product [Staurois parvus]